MLVIKRSSKCFVLNVQNCQECLKWLHFFKIISFMILQSNLNVTYKFKKMFFSFVYVNKMFPENKRKNAIKKYLTFYIFSKLACFFLKKVLNKFCNLCVFIKCFQKKIEKIKIKIITKYEKKTFSKYIFCFQES